MIYCQNIADTLIQADPGHAEFYQENLANYTKKLQALDQEARHLFDHIPSDQKLIVTSEGCFKYFSKAYNIPSAYIWEINTEEEGTLNKSQPWSDKSKHRKFLPSSLKPVLMTGQ